MKKKLLDALVFLRLVNGDGYLSITNIAVIIVLVKLATAREMDITGAATLLTVISAYHFKAFTKRHDAGKSSSGASKNKDLDLEELKADVNKLKLARGFLGGNADNSKG